MIIMTGGGIILLSDVLLVSVCVSVSVGRKSKICCPPSSLSSNHQIPPHITVIFDQKQQKNQRRKKTRKIQIVVNLNVREANSLYVLWWWGGPKQHSREGDMAAKEVVLVAHSHPWQSSLAFS